MGVAGQVREGGRLQRFVLAFFHKVNDAVNVEGGDGFLAGVGLQVGQRDFAVHESVFGEDGGAVGVLQDVEGRLEVRISVCVVGADVVAGKVFSGLLVQAIGQLVREGVAVVGVGALAGGVVPHKAASGGIYVDGCQQCLLHGPSNLAGDIVGPAHAFLQGDVFLFGNQEFGIIATAPEVLHYGAGNFTVVLILPEASVRRAFARGFHPVAIVNQYFHIVVRFQVE